MSLRRYWLALLLALGCGPGAKFVDTTVHGVPNLVQIAPRLWRMGQPANAVAWAYVMGTISNGGRVTVVKLDDDVEGDDSPAVGLGATLLKRPIPPEDDKVWTVLVKPDPKVVWEIVNEIVAAYRRGDVVVWHCVHGRDRTGLVSALVGMRLFGWSKSAAWDDMLAHGFRWELPDLDAFWLENVH